jgi:hypothetical protein
VDPEMASTPPPIPTSTRTIALYEDDLAHPTPFRRAYAVDDLEGRHIAQWDDLVIDVLKSEAEIGITIGELYGIALRH